MPYGLGVILSGPLSMLPVSMKEMILLTESTVEKMFRELMNTPERTEEVFDKAEDLLEDELRPESPLRHRLSVELDELRTLAAKA
ncbi:hypothetical protein Pla22_30570 [Rubripirellula amarantea]|uniref:Uncharacterized protein n=1 Tax=Rubripirellula amarantea TaxID=2527999 RepID=A0A5C5WJL9_9BACT|nr:hypothetical protein [Rubripirellula amarantea]TWT50315.1 hypothetical protein Pla22_30570 [Rubripirellula amarantea]